MAAWRSNLEKGPPAPQGVLRGSSSLTVRPARRDRSSSLTGLDCSSLFLKKQRIKNVVPYQLNTLAPLVLNLIPFPRRYSFLFRSSNEGAPFVQLDSSSSLTGLDFYATTCPMNVVSGIVYPGTCLHLGRGTGECRGQTIGRVSNGNTAPCRKIDCIPVRDKPHRGFLSVARRFIPGRSETWNLPPAWAAPYQLNSTVPACTCPCGQVSGARKARPPRKGVDPRRGSEVDSVPFG